MDKVKQFKMSRNSTSVAETISIDIEETTTTNNSTSVAETNSVDLEETVSYDNTKTRDISGIIVNRYVICPSALIKNQCFNLLLFQRIFLRN